LRGGIWQRGLFVRRPTEGGEIGQKVHEFILPLPPSPCRNHGAVHRLGVQGAGCGAPVRGAGCLLHTEPEERRPVFWSEFKADAAIDHRYGIRVQGEGCEGIQVCGLEEVETEEEARK
jgi:hypothetical protein